MHFEPNTTLDSYPTLDPSSHDPQSFDQHNHSLSYDELTSLYKRIVTQQ
jgi:hypothetical protein